MLVGLLATQPLLPAAAQTPPEDSAAIEEIIVTATKRAESIQDISVAVTALSEDRIEDAGIGNMEDVQYYVPGITVANSFGLTRVFMRGLGDNNTAENMDPAVTMYLDGAVLSARGAQGFSFFDLERIEVLRGPQGTLYGRNSTGGAINLITAKPTEEFEAYAHAGAGNYGLFETEGALSGPLADRLQGRFAWSTVSRNGYGENTVTGNDIDDENTRSMRSSLAFQATEDFDFFLTGGYATRTDSAMSLKFMGDTFPGLPFRAPTGAGGFAEDARDIASEFDPINDRDMWYVTSIADWQLSDTLSVKNTIDYREVDARLANDLDYSSVVNRADVTGNPTTIAEFTVIAEQFSEELQFTYNNELFDRQLTAIFGAFYFTEDVINRLEIGLTPTGGMNGRPKRALLRGNGQADAWAVYWNVAYDVTEQFALKLGGRFSDEKKSIHNQATVIVANGLGPQVSLPPEMDEDSFEKYTPEIGIEWRPDDNLLFYYTYSEGFKAGTGELATTGAAIVKPESIENNEFGIKSSWFDNRLFLNLSAYSYNMEDTQLRFSFPRSEAGIVVDFTNATNLEAHGAEIDASWAVTDRLTLSGSGAWTHARYGEFLAIDQASPEQFLIDPNSPLFDPTATFEDAAKQIGGNEALSTPEWQWSAHGDYAFPLANDGTVTTFVDVAWKDDQFQDVFNNEELKQDVYLMVDARLRYTSPSERWTVDVWAKNLTDEFIAANMSATTLTNTLARTLLPPRTWGATVGYVF